MESPTLNLPQGHSRLPLFVLAGAVAVVMYRLFLGEVLFWGLPALQFIPWRDYGYDLMRSLELPLWNAFNGAGAPLLANYQSALLYPFHWIGLLAPSNSLLAVVSSATAALHLLIAGWGMWRLTMRLGVPPLGAGVSAVAFGMCGYLFGRLHTFPIISAAAWLPWLLWALYGLLRDRRVRDGGWMCLFTALLLLAGHAQTAWYALLLGGLFALWTVARGAQVTADGVRLVGYREPLGRRLAPLLAAFGCVLLGIGAAAAQLLPTAELLSQSQRSSGVDYWFALNFSYAPARTLNLIAPNAFGTPADGSYYTEGAFFEDALYIGLIPLFLALSALVAFWRERKNQARPGEYKHTLFWAAVVLVGFVFALGRYTPIFPFLYENIPTFDLFQAPVRWHLWTTVGLCVLAGIGASGWGRSYKVRRRARLVLVGSMGALIVVGIGLVVLRDPPAVLPALMRGLLTMFIALILLCALTLAQPERGTTAHRRWSGVVLLVISLDLGYAAWNLNPTVPASFYEPLPNANLSAGRGYWSEMREEEVKYDLIFRFDDYRIATDGWAAARQSGLPNLSLLDGEALLNNFDPLLPALYVDYVRLIESSANPRRLLRAAGVDRAFDVGELPAAPRAWLVPSMCWHTDDTALRTALLDATWNPNWQAHSLGDGGCPPSANTQVGDVRLFRDQGSVVTIEVETATDAWLVLADTHYPGWEASIDGEAAYIYPANLAFRAVQVPPGVHTVQFVYRPWWVLPGVFVSIVSILGMLILFRIKPNATRT
jgi:hypothetical protein